MLENKEKADQNGSHSGGHDDSHGHQNHRFEVAVIYNGVKKPLQVTAEEPMKKVLDQAIALFGPLPNPHTLPLYTESGPELPITGTVKEAGIKPNEKLLLRPSAVRGG